MTLRIPPPPSSDKGENTADRFLSVQFRILKTNLTLEEKVAYALILSWQDRTCFYSNANFAELLSCSKRKAQDVLGSLAKKGLVEVIRREGTSNIYRALPWQGLLPLPTETLAESATPPSRICYPPTQTVLPPLAESATNKNIYKINNKIIDKSAVADAPTPTYEFPLTLEEAQDSEVPLESDSLKELTKVSEAPPLPAAPPKAKKAAPTWDDIRAQVSSEEWQAIETWRGYRLNTHKKKKAASIKSVQAAIEAHGANLIAAIHHSIGNLWEGIHYSSYSKPLGASGLTYQQQQTCFRDFWNEAHGLDRPDLSWLTKEQKAFLQKLMKRLCKTEAAYVGDLAKKRSDQFDYQCRDFTNAIKELEQELAK